MASNRSATFLVRTRNRSGAVRDRAAMLRRETQSMSHATITSEESGPIRGARVWRMTQVVVWLVGLTILALLVALPQVGIHAFWNVLIPVAPAVLVFVPGVWRNVCPMGSTTLAPRHADRSRRRHVSSEWHGRLALGGVLLLLLVVPLRHVVLDLNGPATALTIVLLAAIGLVAGRFFEWKSGWCSGLCPVHPVERLYGQEPLLTAPNMHCRSCERCVTACPDSMVSLHPLAGGPSTVERIAGTLMVGGFAGFIWGWFQVPDYAGMEGWAHLAEAYGYPLVGMAATLVLFLMLMRSVEERHRHLVVRTFAAAAVVCYYWYRLPALFGFGPFPGDGMLVDLTGTLPTWFAAASQAATTLLFGWWLLGKSPSRRSWGVRPAYSAQALVHDEPPAAA